MVDIINCLGRTVRNIKAFGKMENKRGKESTIPLKKKNGRKDFGRMENAFIGLKFI